MCLRALVALSLASFTIHSDARSSETVAYRRKLNCRLICTALTIWQTYCVLKGGCLCSDWRQTSKGSHQMMVNLVNPKKKNTIFSKRYAWSTFLFYSLKNLVPGLDERGVAEKEKRG